MKESLRVKLKVDIKQYKMTKIQKNTLSTICTLETLKWLLLANSEDQDISVSASIYSVCICLTYKSPNSYS